MKNYWILFLILTVLITTYVSISAQTINARFTTTVYSWEQQLNDESSANHLRSYQLARIDVGNLGLRRLSFHSYFNLSNDFSEEAVDDPRFWIYNCYFKYKGIVKSLDLSLGRQRIYAGVGYGTIDGLLAQYRMKDYFNVKFYIGVLAPLQKSSEIDKVTGDNLSWGFHLTSKKLKKTFIGISYAQHSRTPRGYTAPGTYSNNFRLDYPVSPLQRQLIGIDLKHYLSSKINFHGRLDYDLVNNTIKRSEVGGRYHLSQKFEIGLDYIYRTPYFDLNSIFWVFDIQPNQEIALRANYYWNSNRFYLSVGSVMFDGDNNQRFNIGWSWKSLYFGYNHRSGYGGDSNAFVTSYNYTIKNKLVLSLSSNIYSYKMINSNESEQAIGETIGLSYRMNRKFSMQGQAQFLKNALYSNDLRFFLRVNYAFFHRFDN